MTATSSEPAGASKLLIDLGPLIVFFAVNFLAPVDPLVKIFVATGAFMVAMVAAMIYSAIRFRSISPLLWFSGIMVVVLGGLTLYLHNEDFIKLKPTIYYGFVAALLGFGLWKDKPLLKMVLGSAYPGLSDTGWRKLTLNWALFFLAMGVLNELVWRNSSTDFWVGFKLWGAIPLTFLFAAANLPMLLRHGLTTEDKKAVEPGPIE
ncbi:septation protein A [Sphingomonas astaxanthinifaciens]|uniref:Inner membrane-spanning protein YciB n=1 Tax=Sphingomonas astaxanthinifaciens DSM 22298 TaxID=1123267 RepID=A0ABQ5ZCR8_9SPHN|nr:septation protein A [Sphingomonas astaxanthinifaciens]GLR48412.1 putative intracellular septation protein A [Sphingomonas astaxanthinifaciens DSM 22298]